MAAKKHSFDPACLTLAEYFYPRAPKDRLYDLAQRIQDQIEAEDLDGPAAASETPVELSPSEAASFDKALARSPRRVSETPADLVGALQDRAHIDAGPFRPARSVKEAEPARPCYASGVAGICRLPAGHDGTHAFS